MGFRDAWVQRNRSPPPPRLAGKGTKRGHGQESCAAVIELSLVRNAVTRSPSRDPSQSECLRGTATLVQEGAPTQRRWPRATRPLSVGTPTSGPVGLCSTESGPARMRCSTASTATAPWPSSFTISRPSPCSARGVLRQGRYALGRLPDDDPAGWGLPVCLGPFVPGRPGQPQHPADGPRGLPPAGRMETRIRSRHRPG